jgi:hypothetical protein
VQHRLLGPLEVLGDDGQVVNVRGTKPKAFLAILALRAGDVVPATRIIDAPDRGSGTAGLPASDVAALDTAWDTGQNHWVSLSSAPAFSP